MTARAKSESGGAAGSQLLLDLGHRPALEREDFLVAPSNQVAVEWIDRWPDWPQPGLALHGEAGAGKTHLAQVWRARSGALAVTPEALLAQEPPELLGEADACVLDDAEALWALEGSQREGERRLLHVFNMLVQRGGQLLLAGRRPPARWARAGARA